MDPFVRLTQLQQVSRLSGASSGSHKWVQGTENTPVLTTHFFLRGISRKLTSRAAASIHASAPTGFQIHRQRFNLPLHQPPLAITPTSSLRSFSELQRVKPLQFLFETTDSSQFLEIYQISPVQNIFTNNKLFNSKISRSHYLPLVYKLQ